MKLKAKYLAAGSYKNVKRSSAGNSGSRSKAAQRQPRNPAPLSASGTKGFKMEYEPARKAKLP